MGIRNFVDWYARQQVALRALLSGNAAEVFSVATATAAEHAARLEQISTPNLLGAADDTDVAVQYAGEIKSAIVLIGSPVSLISNEAQTITGLVLTPGRWRVTGVAGFIPDATTSVQGFVGGLTLVNDGVPADGNRAQISHPAEVPGVVRTCFTVPEIEVGVPVESTVAVYLTGFSTFTVAGMGAFGRITATRL